jgi:hypothetical protein
VDERPSAACVASLSASSFPSTIPVAWDPIFMSGKDVARAASSFCVAKTQEPGNPQASIVVRQYNTSMIWKQDILHISV